MEGLDNVQTQTLGESTSGSPAPQQSQGSSVSAEPTAAAAEPTAAASESTESTQEVQASEPTQEVSTETVEEVIKAFPSVDDFSWDSWDGSNYEDFPEEISPWANKLKEYHNQSLDSLSSANKTEVDYWKRMYEALNYGDEDPRIAEYSTKIEEITAREQQTQEQLAALTEEINAEREAENSRYFSWFEKNYQNKLEELAKTNGTETAEKMVLDLMDLGMEVHVSVDIALMGDKAVSTAKELAKSVKDSNLLLELLNSRFSKLQAAKQEEVKREANPAAQVVAGSAPVSRPTELAREKTPTYGTDNQRMASLMSAAEKAINKSKRR